MRTFAIGDIHGAYKALIQCLERSGFDRKNDQLITLGDICDGWSETFECVEELHTIENRIDLRGNHDEWFRRWLLGGTHPDYWIQGGVKTAISYLRQIGKEDMITGNKYSGYLVALNPGDIPVYHWKFFNSQQLYYQRGMQFFVHAGFDRFASVKENKAGREETFYWDRELWKQARSCGNHVKLTTVDCFSEIFIGHTTCSKIDNMKPVCAGGVWNLDTGAGWEGKLTIMDVDTKEYWQSDVVTTLYPEETARRK